MKHLTFELTMPNVGSWNGQWTGSDKKYFIVKSVSDRFFESNVKQLLNGKDVASFYYNFGDGWGVNIELKSVTKAEQTRAKKNSKGFCGYEWMVDSIINHGEILNTAQRKELLLKNSTILSPGILGTEQTEKDGLMQAQ